MIRAVDDGGRLDLGSLRVHLNVGVILGVEAHELAARGVVTRPPDGLGVLGVIHAEIPPVPIERQHGPDTVLGVYPDVSGLG